MPGVKSWKFPRWGGYGKGRDPVCVRVCDYEGCGNGGDKPAPKSRYSKDKWWFCREHAADYNRNWNYFAGMSETDKARAAAEDEQLRRGFQNSANSWSWMASDETPGQRQRRAALAVLGLDDDASGPEIKSRFRQLAKENHPDRNNGSKDAEDRFKRICAAHSVLAVRNGG